MSRLYVAPALLAITVLALLANTAGSSLRFPGVLAQKTVLGVPAPVMSVHGVGVATTQAESMSIQITYRMHEYYGPGAPRDSSSVDEQVIGSVVDVGVDRDTITTSVLPYGMYGPYGIKRLTATLESPGSEQLHQLISNLVESSTVGGFEIIHVGGRYQHEDCRTLEVTAFETAIAEARERAGILAAITGATVGAIVDITDDSLNAIQGTFGLSTCDSPQKLLLSEPYMIPGAFPVLDPAQPLEVQMVRIVYVTFSVD